MSTVFNYEETGDLEGTIRSNGSPYFKIDAGPTYESFQLETNLAPTEFSVFVDVGNDRRAEITGEQLRAERSYFGKAAVGNFYYLNFATLEAEKQEVKGLGSLCTKPGQIIKFTLSVNAGVADGKWAKLRALMSPYRVEEFRKYILPVPVSVSKVGKNRFDGMPVGEVPFFLAARQDGTEGVDSSRQGIAVQRMHLWSDDVTAVEIMQGRDVVWGKGGMEVDAQNAMITEMGRAPIDGVYSIDFTMLGGAYRDAFDTFSVEAPNLRMNIWTSSADDFDVLAVYLHDMRQLAG